MSYAVVHFLEDDVFSEVPISWLNADKTECLWPPNNPKNVTNLIKMRTAPKTDWVSHKVRLDGIYETLDKAIKKAANGDYTSSEETKGRGMRRKFPYYSSSESSGSISPPPYFDIREAEVIWEEPNCARNTAEHQMPVEQYQLPTPIKDGISMIPDITASTQTKSAPHEDEGRLENKIDMLLTMVNSMSLKLDELNEKLKHIEVSQQPTNTDLKFFLENLPCDTIDDINKLNEYVEKEENKNNFIKYLQTIGGAHPKDKVNRIMKAIMTNKFAIGCSWMGLRNNMKASDFLCFKIAQSFASQSFIQSADFEKVAAEWLRLATLRFKRQK